MLRTTKEANVQEAFDFLQHSSLGSLATMNAADTSPDTALVYYRVYDEHTIYFVTLKESTKVRNIDAHSNVGFLVGQETNPKVLQIRGVAALVKDAQHKAALLYDFSKAARENKGTFNFPPPVSLSSENDDIEVVRITITWLKYSDFTQAPPIILEKSFLSTV